MIPVYDFITAIKFARFTAARKDCRDYLKGIHLRQAPGKLLIASADGHRISRIALDVETELLSESGYIICINSIDDLLAAIRTKKTDRRRLSIGESRHKRGGLFVSCEGTTVALSCIDERFPDILKALPKGQPKGAPEIGINTRHLADAGRALDLVAHPSYHVIKIESWDANTAIKFTAPTCHGGFEVITEPASVYIMPIRI